jgi:hypothetical protein
MQFMMVLMSLVARLPSLARDVAAPSFHANSSKVSLTYLRCPFICPSESYGSCLSVTMREMITTEGSKEGN